MLGQIIFFVSVSISLIFGSIVLLKNYRKKSNLFFSLATASYIFQSIFNFLSITTDNYNYQILYIRLVIFFSIISIALTYFLIISITKDYDSTQSKQNRNLYLILFTLFISFLSLTPLIVNSIDIVNQATKPIFNRFGLIGFLSIMGIYFFKTFNFLLTKINSKYTKDKYKIYYKYLLYSLLPTYIFSPVTGVILPVVFNNDSFILLTPLYSTIFVVAVGLLIIKHSLFDIKPIFMRFVAYVTLLSATLFITSAISLLIAFTVYGVDNVGTDTVIIFSTVSLLSLIILQPLRYFILRVTNKFLFQYTYDAQKALNDLNAGLVSSSKIEKLINSANDIFSKSLKPVSSGIVLDGENNNYHSKDFDLNDRLIQKIRNVFNSRPEKTIYFENIDSEDTELKELFRSLKVVLITKLNIQDTIVGFIIFGEKKSGNNYNEKDIQFIETAADSIAIATQNALRYEEIAAFNFNLQKKINSATADLRKTNEKLKALDEAKDEFISMASHQLRTPLTSVKGYLSMVLEGDAGPINDLQRKFLSQSFISSQRMVFLISDLLNASRLKTGKFVIESQKTYLPDVVEEELKQLEETVKARGLTLEFNKPKDFPFVNIDENKIRQVIMNFADNAIYYTPAGGKIEVNLRATKDVIEYTVKDSGMGVPKADQKHLFTKFYRASNAKKARPDGTGLGIFMAKKVIIAQGGALIFKSIEGKGSTFGFSIPLKKIEIQ